MVDKPEYEPPYRTPRWVSDMAVSDALKELLDGVVKERGGDDTVKAICWDVRDRFRKALLGLHP